MFGIDELSNLTWDSAAWIYSVIIGVVLVRYFMFIANLLQEPKAIKFYYPYLAFTLVNILHLYLSWYTAKPGYTVIEGHTLQFAARSSYEAISCIAGLIFVPPDKLLEDFFDMKSWFMKVKKAYFFMGALCHLLLAIQAIGGLLYPEMLKKINMTTEQVISASVFMVIMILINMVSAFSKNDYYLSFHGTLIVVFISFQLSTL